MEAKEVSPSSQKARIGYSRPPARYGRVQTTRHAVDKKTIVGPRRAEQRNPVIGVSVDYHADLRRLCDRLCQEQRSTCNCGFSGRKGCRYRLAGPRYGFDHKLWRQIRADECQIESALLRPTRREFRAVSLFRANIMFGHEYQRSAAFVDRTDNLHALGPSFSIKNTTGLLGPLTMGNWRSIGV